MWLALLLCAGAVRGQTSVMEIFGSLPYVQLGRGVAGMDDVTGDGIPEFAAAGLKQGVGPGREPYVRIFSGADGSLVDTVEGFAPVQSNPGVRLADAGDVNADGTRDLVIGFWRIVPTAGFAGSAYVLSGFDRTVLFAWNGAFAGDDYGFSVAAAGDVNGDGSGDVLIGAPQTALFGNGYFELRSGANGSVLMVFGGFGPGSRYGHSLAGAGDFDGDGTADVIIGAPTSTPPGASAPNTGAAQVISGATSLAVATIIGPGTGSDCGRAVGSLGDLDGDGDSEVAVGIPSYAIPGLSVMAGTTVTQIYYASLGLGSGDGSVLSVIGDLDNDLMPEVLTGNGQIGPTGLPLDTVHVLSGATGSMLFSKPPTGLSAGGAYRPGLAGLGDITGDGVGEVLIGDHLAGVSLAGRLRVISGAPLPPPAVTTLGPGFAPSGSPPQLSAGFPMLGTTWTLSVNGAPAAAPGYLVAAPGPENPLTVAPQITVYPDLLQASDWLLVPVLTAGGGFWTALVPIPFDHQLSGVEFILQAWFPAPGGLQAGAFSNGLRTTFGY